MKRYVWQLVLLALLGSLCACAPKEEADAHPVLFLVGQGISYKDEAVDENGARIQPNFFSYYPEVKGPINPSTQALNQKLKQGAIRRLTILQESSPAPKALTWDYEVMRNDGVYFSLLYTGELDFGGEQPQRRVAANSFRVDGATLGEELTLADCFSVPVEEYRPILLEALLTQGAGQFTRESLAEFLDCASFYLSEEALTLVFPEDTLGDRSLGTPALSIPYETLGDMWALEAVEDKS